MNSGLDGGGGVLARPDADLRRSWYQPVVVWATCFLVTLGGYQLLLSPGRSPINLVFIAALLGILMATFAIGPAVGAFCLLTLGVLLASSLPTAWLLSVLPPDVSRAAHDVQWIGALTVLIAGLVIAVWRRPSMRGADGTRVMPSLLVNLVAVLLTLGGPIAGWAAYQAFAKDDIYLRPFTIGLTVGIFGLLLFGGYSAFSTVIGRPRSALLLAVAYPFVLVVAALGPSWTPRPRGPEHVVENVLPDGRLVRASNALAEREPANALDGRVDTAWNAGTAAPAWIEVDLGKPTTIAGIGLLVAQAPSGSTVHEVTGRDAGGREWPIATFSSVTHEGDWLRQSLTQPVVGIQSIRITTVASPSWVAWWEIELDTRASD